MIVTLYKGEVNLNKTVLSDDEMDEFMLAKEPKEKKQSKVEDFYDSFFE